MPTGARWVKTGERPEKPGQGETTFRARNTGFAGPAPVLSACPGPIRHRLLDQRGVDVALADHRGGDDPPDGGEHCG